MLKLLNNICWLAIFFVVFTVGAMASYPPTKQTTPETVTIEPERVKRVAKATAPKYHPLLPALIKQESNWNPKAVSKRGARGLTQVMPKTSRNPGYGIQPMKNFSVKEQIRFGNDYITTMHELFGCEVLAAAAYNAGPATVEKALKRAKGDKDLAIKYLPAETRDYVVKVAGYEPPNSGYTVSAFNALDY